MTRIPIWPSTVQIQLDGTGAGTAKLGPTGHGQTWDVETVSVKTAQTVTTGTCQCRIYVGSTATDDNFRDGTFSGDTGDSTDRGSGQIRLGSYVFAVWSGGVASDLATLTISGTMDMLWRGDSATAS